MVVLILETEYSTVAADVFLNIIDSDGSIFFHIMGRGVGNTGCLRVLFIVELKTMLWAMGLF